MIKRLLKIIGYFGLMFLALVVFNSFPEISYSQALPDISKVVENSGLKTASSDAGATASSKIISIITQGIIPNIKNLFVGISIVIIIYYIFQFIIATSSEEIEEQKKNLLWSAVGFGLIGISMYIVDIFAPSTLGPAGSSAIIKNDLGDIALAESLVYQIITYLQVLIGGVAVLFIIIAAIRIITAQGVEEEIDNQKKNFAWGAIGLMIVMLSRPIVTTFYQVDQTAGAIPGNVGEEGSRELFGIIAFVLQFLGIVGVFAFILAGVYYIISLGDEEKVTLSKSIMMWTIIGIVIIYSSYAIVAYIFRPPGLVTILSLS